MCDTTFESKSDLAKELVQPPQSTGTGHTATAESTDRSNTPCIESGGGEGGGRLHAQQVCVLRQSEHEIGITCKTEWDTSKNPARSLGILK
jgi:hypothetical protein